MKDIDKLNIWLDFLVDKGREIEEVQGFIESSSSEKHALYFSDMLIDYEEMVVKAKKIIFDIVEDCNLSNQK